ncbi:hypothetical protein B566_EDAN009052 [Ephemera danica]|nr:hypothetical protein B566_EDAN009052 [Ephemera danica]
MCMNVTVRCDGHNDCGDSSDEWDCPKPIGGCAACEFQCLNGQCIPISARCDGLLHCADASDEWAVACADLTIPTECKVLTSPTPQRNETTLPPVDITEPTPEPGAPTRPAITSFFNPAGCSAYQFLCSNGQCVDLFMRCDGERDCIDGSDEDKCGTRLNVSKTMNFRCKESGQTVPLAFRCNGDKNCKDHTDERDCATGVCNVHMYRCANGKCIIGAFVCDNDNDCGDSSDERFCSRFSSKVPPLPTFPTPTVKPRTTPTTVLPSTLPTALPPIPGVPGGCTAFEFRCKNSQCIDLYLRCDGDRDCTDGSDEELCGTRTCKHMQTPCQSGRCLTMSFRCDGDNDCGDNSDERDCNIMVQSAYEFRCRNWQCIDMFRLCDGTRDCDDGSDELKCGKREYTLGFHVSPNSLFSPHLGLKTVSPLRFRCRDNGQSIQGTARCSGSKNCKDHTDEQNCTLSSYVCDNDNDCGDNSDERYCHHMRSIEGCAAWQFKCQSGRCLRGLYRCDGNKACEDESDELSCPQSKCGIHSYECLNGKCINLEYRCDRDNDCGDNSDEQNCLPESCQSGELTCDNGMCVTMDARCDGYNDCGDASDEWDCPKPPGGCGRCEFECSNGQCVPLAARCDGLLHCSDASDEWANACAGDLSVPLDCEVVPTKAVEVNVAQASTGMTATVISLLVLLGLLCLVALGGAGFIVYRRRFPDGPGFNIVRYSRDSSLVHDDDVSSH